MPAEGLLIAAALPEELGVALNLCRNKRRLPVRGIAVWEAAYGDRALLLLRTGVGPARAERSLRLFLAERKPASVLMVGYGGALDPALLVGDLVVGEIAVLLGEDHSPRLLLEDLRTCGTWPLHWSHVLEGDAHAAGLTLRKGTIVTVPHLIGHPEQKRYLRNRFEALIIDMETAVLARACAQSCLSFACVRAVTDTARDEFLAPFTYDPNATYLSRTLRVLRTGNWIRSIGAWRENAALARRSIREFLTWYIGRKPEP